MIINVDCKKGKSSSKSECSWRALSWGREFNIAVYFFITFVLISFVSVELYGEQISPSQNDTVIEDSTNTVAQYIIGDLLQSLNDLNKVAINQGAVFIYIPIDQNEVITSQTNAAVLAAQESLKNLDVVVGLYTLSTNSADYSQIIQQVKAPAFLVASKGGGIVPVSGEITRDYLLQAFLTANKTTTCGQ